MRGNPDDWDIEQSARGLTSPSVSKQGAGRIRSGRPHYLDPEPQTPPAWLGIGLALILVGCAVVVTWTAIVVAGAMGVMR